MIEETTNKGQVTINDDLVVSEEFLGLYTVSSIDAASLISVIN